MLHGARPDYPGLLMADLAEIRLVGDLDHAHPGGDIAIALTGDFSRKFFP